MCLAKDRVRLYCDDAPSEVSIHRAHREKVWTRRADVNEHPARTPAKERVVDGPIELVLSMRPRGHPASRTFIAPPEGHQP